MLLNWLSPDEVTVVIDIAEEKTSASNGKRRYVAMTNDKYTGTAKRVCNTYNMPR